MGGRIPERKLPKTHHDPEKKKTNNSLEQEPMTIFGGQTEATHPHRVCDLAVTSAGPSARKGPVGFRQFLCDPRARQPESRTPIRPGVPVPRFTGQATAGGLADWPLPRPITARSACWFISPLSIACGAVFLFIYFNSIYFILCFVFCFI